MAVNKITSISEEFEISYAACLKGKGYNSVRGR